MPSLLDILSVLIEFLPQVFLLYFILALIDQSGLLSLIAKLLHLPMRNVLPICLSFSCTTLGVCAARDNPARRRLTYFLSFIPCSAQLPLIMFLLVTTLKFSVGAVLLLYLISILIGLTVISLIPKVQINPEPNKVQLRWPSWRRCLGDSCRQTLSFAKKILIAFTLCAFVIVILARFSFAFKLVERPEDSILFAICGVLSPIFKPIGLHSPAIICALLFGIIAKEAAISVLLFFPKIVAELTVPMILALVTFYTLYPKCISAQTAVNSCCGRKTAVKSFFTNLLVAYAAAFVVYTLCGIFN